MKIKLAASIAVLTSLVSNNPTAAELIKTDSENAIKGSYIVVFKDDNKNALVPELIVDDFSIKLENSYGIKVEKKFNELNGALVKATSSQLKELLNDPSIEYIEQDQYIFLEPSFSVKVNQSNATWGLDRIDQRSLPLNSSYNYSFDGTGTNVYIIDSGINIAHNEFGNRARNGANFSSESSSNDCNGHGTHVAGTVGGSQYGVAKNVNLVSVKVFGCNGTGSTSSIISALDWVINDASGPSVINMSLGGSVSQALNQAVSDAYNEGLPVVVAAGNDGTSACTSSPASAVEAITVGATTSADSRSSFSNYGSCVDIFAPGTSITSAAHNSNSGTRTLDGTSMAAPHVAGVVALLLDENPARTPAQISTLLNSNSTKGKLSNLLTGSPNRLLYSVNSNSEPSLDLNISSVRYEYAQCNNATRHGFIDWSAAPDATNYTLQYKSGTRWYEAPSSGTTAHYSTVAYTDRSISMRVWASNGSTDGQIRNFQIYVPRCGFDAPPPR